MTEKKYQPKNRDELQALCDDLNVNLGDIDTSKIIDMSGLFKDSSRTNEQFVGIETWDVSSVITMSWMFAVSRFNGDISRWDVSKVEDMCGMFLNSKFNGDISKWNVSNVIDMFWMFKKSQFDGDISNWKQKPY